MPSVFTALHASRGLPSIFPRVGYYRRKKKLLWEELTQHPSSRPAVPTPTRHTDHLKRPHSHPFLSSSSLQTPAALPDRVPGDGDHRASRRAPRGGAKRVTARAQVQVGCGEQEVPAHGESVETCSFNGGPASSRRLALDEPPASPSL